MKISPAQVTEARRLLGWTQERLSIEARVPPTAVSTFEGGTRTGASSQRMVLCVYERPIMPTELPSGYGRKGPSLPNLMLTLFRLRLARFLLWSRRVLKL